MRFFVASAALSAALIGAVVFATGSQAAGLTGLHRQAQIGNRTCLVDHFHYGESGAWSTREQAVEAAAQSWASLPRFEYGREWAEFRTAHLADMQCGQVESDRGGVLWTCKAKAAPCRVSAPAYVAVPQAAPVFVQHAPRLRPGAQRFLTPIDERHRFHHRPGLQNGARAGFVWPGDAR